MEKAIHQKRASVSYAVVKTAIVIIVLVSIALFIFYQLDGNVRFNHLINNVGILEKSLDILYYVGESARSAVVVKLVNLGYIPRNRNGPGGKFDLNQLLNFQFIAPNLTRANNEMRNSISYFEEEQREEFYELIPVYYPDNITLNSYHNAFDIHSQLVSSGLKLYTDLPDTPAPDNPDLNFIINNTLSSLLTHDTKVFSLLKEEDARIVNEMAEFVLILLGILVLTGMIVILITIKNEVNFIKKKMLFFEHFFRINEVKIKKSINKATRFYEALKDNNYNEEDVMYEVQSGSQNKSKTWASTNRAHEQDNSQLAIKKRKANFHMINPSPWQNTTFVIV